MSKVIYVEVVDDDTVNIYHDGKQELSQDTALVRYDKFIWVLLDPLHTSSKTFTREVKNKKVLDKVIISSLDSYLLQPAEHYHFSYHKIADVLWVSWIEKSRLDYLKQRFIRYKSNINALVSAPLLVNLQAEKGTLFRNKPFVYGVLGDETLAMHHSQIDLWLQSSQEAFQQEIDLFDDSKKLKQMFAGKSYKDLPNLWLRKDLKSRQFSYKISIVAYVLLLAIWVINSYLSLQRSVSHEQQTKQQQTELLKQVFPQASTGDPYGRLLAEYNSLPTDDFSALEKVNKILSEQAINLDLFDIDLAARQLVLSGQLSAQTLANFENAGFSVSQQQSGILLSW